MMKKTILSLCMMATLGTAPVALTSCDDDDVQTVLNLLDLFLSSDNLAGEWISSDQTYEFYFENGSGLYIYLDENNEQVRESFTYTTDGTANTLTMTFSDKRWQFTVVTLTETTLELKDSSGTKLSFTKYTGS